MSAYLVDTNVLGYAYDPTDGLKCARAAEILDQLAVSGQGVLTPQILGEFFVAVTGKIPAALTFAEAGRSVGNYLRSWRVLDLTGWTVLEATQGVLRHQLSYWDALVWASAKLNQVPFVLNEDFADGLVLEGVRFLNPFHPSFRLAAPG